MSASNENNPPIRILVKDIRILSDKELSKTVNILIDKKPVDDDCIAFQADKAPDKAWKLKNVSALSESLTIQPYLHRPAYRFGERKRLTDIEIKANDLQQLLIERNGPTDYEVSQDGSTIIVGVEHETLDAKTENAPIVSMVLKDIKLSGVKKATRFYVCLFLDNDTQHKTQAIKGKGTITWDMPVHFDIQASSVLELQIIKVHYMHQDQLYRRAWPSISHLLKDGVGPSEVTLDLFKNVNTDIMQDIHISLLVEQLLNVQRPADLRQTGAAVEAAAEAAISHQHLLAFHSGNVLAEVSHGIRSVQSMVGVIDPIMEKLDSIAKIHPYVNIAWKIMSAVLKIYTNELNRNQRLQDLLGAITKNYAFFDDKPQHYIDKHQSIITELLNQTTECGYFIQDYFGSGIGSHIKQDLFSSIQAQIDSYQKIFSDLYQQLLYESTAKIEISVMHSLETLDKLLALNTVYASDQKLHELAYAKGASLDLYDICLPGTRTEILDGITEWISQTNKNNVTSVYLLLLFAKELARRGIHTKVSTAPRRKKLRFCLNRCSCNKTDLIS